ncbi:hypothetical protein [Micromonospora echinospora]|uniref:hypothetical protein n=1 Tax=Micromonospora echinospora TaxID=1877 RepID=UPI003A843979
MIQVSGTMQPAMDRIGALEQAVAALQSNRLGGTAGQATVATGLLGGATRDVPVTFTTALPDTNYVAIPVIDGPPGILGTLQALFPVTNKSATGCTVTVKNTALLTLGVSGTVTVVAIRLGA